MAVTVIYKQKCPIHPQKSSRLCLETLAQGLEVGGPAGRREREEAWLHPSLS